jgi:hypothetical protein
MRTILLLAIGMPLTGARLEIATGKMLGDDYDPRSFYTRAGGGVWRKTYSESRHRPEAAGRLMNLRVAQALYHDEWLTEVPFHPEAHTRRVIGALDAWRDAGVLAISVSLQGGNMAYERTNGLIRRERAYKLGPAKGAHVSAFRPDGSLKPEWIERLVALQKAIERRGMFLNLILFYQGQDEILSGPDAIRAAVRNAVDVLVKHDMRNVILEIANEVTIRGWDHDLFIEKNLAELIRLARSRMAQRKPGFRVPISASTAPSMKLVAGMREEADLTIVHGNGKTPQAKRDMIRALLSDPSVPGPVYMNEDDNGRETTVENLRKELASCDAVFESGGSWGYMPWVQMQIFPFRHFQPGNNTEVNDGMPADTRDPNYLAAVLAHIRRLVLR